MRSVSRVVAGLLLGSLLASPQPAAAQTASAQTVKVGVMLPTTGPRRGAGHANASGIRACSLPPRWKAWWQGRSADLRRHAGKT